MYGNLTGYTCFKCSQWIQSGGIHICPLLMSQQQTWSWRPSLTDEEIDRIADAVVEKLLARRNA